jgi:hypothetical protein
VRAILFYRRLIGASPARTEKEGPPFTYSPRCLRL